MIVYDPSVASIPSSLAQPLPLMLPAGTVTVQECTHTRTLYVMVKHVTGLSPGHLGTLGTAHKVQHLITGNVCTVGTGGVCLVQVQHFCIVTSRVQVENVYSVK